MKFLYDLQQEINRLFIAGSKFAKNDVRLQKHLPTLTKMGEKAPVFKKLASDIEDLLNADNQQSAEKLMAISTLIYSILYTQGETILPETENKTQTPIISIDEVKTDFSYLQLKPVIQALTVSNSGRLEVVKEAFEKGIFKDSRTHSLLSSALADRYSELSDYIEKTIIPSIGTSLLPFLIADFQYDDKTEHVRRLRLLHQFGYSEIDVIIQKIFEENLPNLQAEALILMSQKAENEAFITKFISDKNKTVRAAAFKALATIGSKSSLEKLYEIYTNNKAKNNREIIAEALSIARLPFFFQEIHNQIVGVFEELLSTDPNDKELVSKRLERFLFDIEIYKNKEYPETYAFFERILSEKKNNKWYRDLSDSHYYYSAENKIIRILETFDNQEVMNFYEKNVSLFPSQEWFEAYFYKAVSMWSKEKIFDIFSQLLGKKRIDFDTLGRGFLGYYYQYASYSKSDTYIDKMDNRWATFIYEKIESIKKWEYRHYTLLNLMEALEPQSQRFYNALTRLLSVVKHQTQEHTEIIRLLENTGFYKENNNKN